MRMPKLPPTIDDLLKAKALDLEKIMPFGEKFHEVDTDLVRQYLHWDELRYKKPLPVNWTSEEVWANLKFRRNYRMLPFSNKNSQKFCFVNTDQILEGLFRIDELLGRTFNQASTLFNEDQKHHYLVADLIEEAITSSQLEGAVTTRKVAKEMIRVKRRPQSESEQMILNNYNAMCFVREHKDSVLTTQMILELHHIVVFGTLEDEKCGAIRMTDDINVIDTHSYEILHQPPQARSLMSRMEVLCQFANEKDDAVFLHPVLRAIMIHFMLAYDHPFVDGMVERQEHYFIGLCYDQVINSRNLSLSLKLLSKHP